MEARMKVPGVSLLFAQVYIRCTYIIVIRMGEVKKASTLDRQKEFFWEKRSFSPEG